MSTTVPVPPSDDHASCRRRAASPPAPRVPDVPCEWSSSEEVSPPPNRHQGLVSFYLCVSDIATTPSREDLCIVAEDHARLAATGEEDESPSCDFVLRSEQRFRHTVHRAERSSLPRHKTSFEVDHTVQLARQRRAMVLAARRKSTDDKRSVVEALHALRCDEAAQRLESKLYAAAKRREEQLNARREARVSSERIRSGRLNQARHRRVKVLAKYSSTVVPMLTQFRESGLVLRGGATRLEEIERVLRSDGRAHCHHCNGIPGKSMCPATKRTHPRRLVHLSEQFLRSTGEIRKWFHQEKKECTEDTTASAAKREARGETPYGCGDDTDAESPAKGCPPVAQAAVPVGEAPNPVIGVPHFLPLAFHQAADHSSNSDTTFAGKNVVLVLEEVFLGAKTVESQYRKFLHIFEGSDGVEEGVEEPEEVPQELLQACEHLRHTLTRFTRSWSLFVRSMNPAANGGSKESNVHDHKGEEQRQERMKNDMKEKAIKAYLNLVMTQHWRKVDIARRQELLSKPDTNDALRRREYAVSQKRQELSKLMQLQMNDLHRTIEKLGGLSDLEEQLAKLNYNTTSSSSATSASSRTVFGHTRQDPSCSSSGLFRTNSSADWCDQQPTSTASEAEAVQGATAPARQQQSTTKTRRPSASSSKSSGNFRAQLAADRARLRRERCALQQEETRRGGEGEGDGNDGDAE